MRMFGRGRSRAEPEVVERPVPGVRSDPVTAPPAPVLRVLVVDDDEDLRVVMCAALRRHGFEVQAAADAAEALALAGVEPGPELILVDLHMPDVGGLELIPQLREAAPRARFVVCSSISASYMIEASLELGAHGFIVKGVTGRSIATHLRRVASSGAVKVVRPYPLNRDYPDAPDATNAPADPHD